jgi:membrane protein
MRGFIRQLINKWGHDEISRRAAALSFYAFLSLGPLLIILVSIIGLAYGRSGAEASIVLQMADFFIFLAVITLLAVFLFRVLPASKKSWKAIWLGSFVTALLFSVGKLAIGLYLGRSSTSSSYGAAGAFIVLLLWIYYSARSCLWAPRSQRPTRPGQARRSNRLLDCVSRRPRVFS